MKTLKDLKRDHVIETLKFFHWNRAKAARSLGVSLRSVRIYIIEYRALGIEIPDSPYYKIRQSERLKLLK